MDTRQLEYFLAVAESGSMTAAAKALHMTQPPLSLAIAKLEADLRVRLFERRARGVVLTEAGAHLHAAGGRLVAEHRALEATMRLLGAGLSGELRLAAGPIVYWSYLAECLASFSAQHPEIRLVLRDPAPRELLDEVAGRMIDIGIVACAQPETLALDLAPDLQTAVVAELPLKLATPASWAPLPDVVDVADLLEETWILAARVPRFPGLHENADVVFARAGRRPERIIEVQTPQTALSLLTAGIGVSVMVEPDAEPMRGIRTHDIRGGWPPLYATVVWPTADDTLAPVARVFLAELLASARGAASAPHDRPTLTPSPTTNERT